MNRESVRGAVEEAVDSKFPTRPEIIIEEDIMYSDLWGKTKIYVRFSPDRQTAVGAHIAFRYDPKRKKVTCHSIFVHPEIRRCKYSRALVSIMEDFAKIAGCSHARVALCDNHSFWNYMGYAKRGNYRIKKV